MPLKILLADDSMTAQKMGKEILTGAGYEVIAVSNGAAAAKKLAEKPDICVLDIIMPGYTGIEICEKIRASIETAKMPVLAPIPMVSVNTAVAANIGERRNDRQECWSGCSMDMRRGPERERCISQPYATRRPGFRHGTREVSTDLRAAPLHRSPTLARRDR